MATEKSVRKVVSERAEFHCEYCLLPQREYELPFHVEHIVAKQHGIDDSLENLAFACDRCNSFKGPNISTVDPDSKERTELFNPRVDLWVEHFEILEGLIIGLTSIGRGTSRLLRLNDQERVQLRLLLIAQSRF